MYPFGRNVNEVIDLDEESYTRNYQAMGGYSAELYGQTNQILDMLQNPYTSFAYLLSSYWMCADNSQDSIPLIVSDVTASQKTLLSKVDLSTNGRSSAFTECIKS